MSTLQSSPGDRNSVQAINALKRGSYLLKNGRWGKPKFCPFRLSDDETTLIWYAGKVEKQLRLSQVSRIIPGQRTVISSPATDTAYDTRRIVYYSMVIITDTSKFKAIFQRCPQPEKEYQSFSLIYGKNSLNVICKDKCEAEIWFGALRALISRGNCQKWRTEFRTKGTLSDCSSDRTERNSTSIQSNSSDDTFHEDKRSHQTIVAPFENLPQKRLGRSFFDIVLYIAPSQHSPHRDSVLCSDISQPPDKVDYFSHRNSADTSLLSFSSAISTSSLESSSGDIPLSSIFMWGGGVDDSLLDGGMPIVGESFSRKDAFLPKILESASTLDAQNIACGRRHVVLITRHGQIFSWGDGSGGKLGHGSESDICSPKFIDALSGLNIVSIGCGEYHTCAVTRSGDLYTWGDGINNLGLLGHGTEFSYWTPRKIEGQMGDIRVTSISCGPWHSAAITSIGQLFTFGDGTFGALGHGDRCCTSVPREVQTLKGQKAVKVSCGFWHTAAIIEDISPTGKLYTWGNGDKGQLGHGDKLSRLIPCCVTMSNDRNFCQVACGHSITVALTICGQVYTMGSNDTGCPGNSHLWPILVEGKLKGSVIEEISCGSHHVVALTSKSEVFTWGKGINGQLGYGGNADRKSPTLVEALEGKQVKKVICGTNFTAAICIYQCVCKGDYSICAGCHSPFNFRRKRHNCYNCGLVFCKVCTKKKSLSASLAPDMKKQYRVCENCYPKLNKGLDCKANSRPPKSKKELEKETFKAKEQGMLSRLSSYDSFRRSNRQLCKRNQELYSTIAHYPSFHEGDFECDRSLASSPSMPVLDSCEKINASLPGSKMHSPASFSSVKSSPHSMLPPSSFGCVRYHEEVIDDSKQTNDDFTEEMSFLREQVEVLTRKSEVLKAKLERTSNQLNEAIALVHDEFEKNDAAKEAIRSLMRQLEDMAARVPQGASCRLSGPLADKIFNVLNTAST